MTVVTRASRPRPEDLDPAQRQVYDAIAAGPRAGTGLVAEDGTLRGPFNAMLLHPDVGGPLQALGAALRFGGRLPDRARELAVLRVAVSHGSRFERTAHEAIGRAVGLTEHELTALLEDDAVHWSDPLEAAVDEAARVLCRRDDVDDAAYRRWAGVLGEDGLMEVVTLVGYYGLLADVLRVFAPEQ